MAERTMDRPVPAPAAPRLRRPSWRDTRLLIGVLIILVSVVAGARIFALADDTVPVYAASAAVAPGTRLEPGLLSVVRVRLEGTSPYLSAAQPLPTGRVLLRSVGRGELVPLSALGPATALTSRPVSIPLEEPPPGLGTGSLVDVWASPRLGQGAVSYGTARRLVGAVAVAHVGEGGDALTARRTVPVQVMVPMAQVAPLLDALANGARIAVVPVPGSAATGGAE